MSFCVICPPRGAQQGPLAHARSNQAAAASFRNEPTVGGGWRAGPLAPSPAATLAAKVMSAALTYIRSFLGCCGSCAGARWPRSARGGGAVAASFLGDFRAPLPCIPAPASSPTPPLAHPPPNKDPFAPRPGNPLLFCNNDNNKRNE